MKTILVNQECFKTIKDFDTKPEFRKGNGKGGVYIWGFSLEEADYTTPTSPEMFFPYYVGESLKDVYQRASESISDLYGGNKCSIFDIRKCRKNHTLIGEVHAAYQKDSDKAKPKAGPRLPDVRFPNLLYFPEGLNVICNRFSSKAIIDELDWMIKHFCIMFLIPEKPTKKVIYDMEKIVGDKIDYSKLITERYLKIPKDYQIEIINKPKNIILT